MGYLRDGRRKRNEICHNSSLGDEDDTRTSSTRIVQRKRVIPHSTQHVTSVVVMTMMMKLPILPCS